jgi:uncharacterized repeat protein (TIGR04076 family)
MAKCKITVLRRMYNKDLAQEYCVNPEAGVCSAFQEGQTFLLEDASKPPGFCEEAWSAITRYVFAFVSGGGGFFSGRWMKDENTMIACCNDGIRPVVFKLERVDG